MKKTILLVLLLVVAGSVIAWNPNPTYDPFEVVWNEIGVLNESIEGFTETDPQVGALTADKWCSSDGTQVNCGEEPPAAATHTHSEYLLKTDECKRGYLYP